MIKRITTQRNFKILLAGLAWFAVIFQFCLAIENIFNFISYFTVLSNLLVAISLSFSSLFSATAIGKYFSSIKVQSAIAVYIFIVGLVYNTVLRGIWEPKGWQLLVDNLLHVAVPVLYMLYWLFFIPKGVLTWKDGITWVYFPFLYLIYTLIRGHFTNWYPYPFMDVAAFGYKQVAINSLLMTLTFFGVGLLLIAVNRFVGKND